MLNLPLNNRETVNSITNNNLSTSRQLNQMQNSNQNKNFLFDIILPNTLNIQNIRIIKKHQHSSSPDTIQKKVTEMKKSKVQSKIQSIVKKNAELELKEMETKPKLKKFTKQTVKKQSKFESEEKYKKYLFQQDLTVEKMKLAKYQDSFLQTKDKQNSSQVGQSKLTQPLNQRWESEAEAAESPYIIELDQKLDQVTKMQEENFQPFKQKVMKVIDKTIKAGKHHSANALMEKVNFYLTSVTQPHGQEKFKRISVDAQKKDRQVISYCEQIEKGMLVKAMTSPRKKNVERTGLNLNQTKQFRSASSGFMKTRPQTAALSSRTGSSTKVGRFSTTNRSLSTSQLNRYTPSSAESNIKSKPSTVQNEKYKLAYLLQDIESACWTSKVNSQILSKRLNKMSQEWNIDEDGFRIYDNKKMDMNEDTLEMIKRLRKKASQIDKVEQNVMKD